MVKDMAFGILTNLQVAMILAFVLLAHLGVVYGYQTGMAELVVSDIWLEPKNPQAGQKTSINAKVYNGGTYDTDYYAKTVTVAYFIDGELRKITEMPPLKPGLGNGIEISSGPLWEAEWGNHTMTVIVNYHKTIPEMFDTPENNKFAHVFLIEPYRQSKLDFGINPQYAVLQKNLVITINGTLTQADNNTPLAKQNLVLSVGDKKDSLVTDKEGKFQISKAIGTSEEKIPIVVSYGGEFPHLPVNSTNYMFNIKSSKDNSAMIIKLDDPASVYSFDNLHADIVIYQDSYDKTYKKISTKQPVTLDNKTAWVGLEANHSYLSEVYLSGRFFFSSEWNKVKESEVIQSSFTIPQTAQLRFHVTGLDQDQLAKSHVQNWIYTTSLDSSGYSDWIDTLPTRTKNEPYIAVLSTGDQIFRSEPFFVESGERRIIEIDAQNTTAIPAWIKNNAKWWSTDQITTQEFVKAVEYLVQQKIILMPATYTETHESQVPNWIKNNAGWWADGKITDSDFVKAIQYLMENGIIRT